MAIINITPTAADAVDKHKEQIQQFLRMVKGQYITLGNAFWANRQFTAPEMGAAYGTDAAELFNLSNKLATFIYEVTGETIAVVPDKYEYAFAQDGSVTITLKPTPVPTPAE